MATLASRQESRGSASAAPRWCAEDRPSIVGSPNVIAGYKLVNNGRYPGIAEDFARTFQTLKSLHCDIFLGAHGDYYGMEGKFARMTAVAPNVFVDPDGYRTYVAERQQAFLTALERQKK
jgi:metallo-beta-lactamase class B